MVAASASLGQAVAALKALRNKLRAENRHLKLAFVYAVFFEVLGPPRNKISRARVSIPKAIFLRRGPFVFKDLAGMAPPGRSRVFRNLPFVAHGVK